MEPNEQTGTNVLANEWNGVAQQINKALGRDAILGANDLTTERVDVPEWGGFVYVRQLTAGERDHIEGSLLDKNGNADPAKLKDYRARMAAMAIVDEAGARMFGDRDLRALSHKSAIAMDRILDVVRRLSGMDTAVEDELAAKSEAGQDAGLPID